jgi:hypothetical protein
MSSSHVADVDAREEAKQNVTISPKIKSENHFIIRKTSPKKFSIKAK